GTLLRFWVCPSRGEPLRRPGSSRRLWCAVCKGQFTLVRNLVLVNDLVLVNGFIRRGRRQPVGNSGGTMKNLMELNDDEVAAVGGGRPNIYSDVFKHRQPGHFYDLYSSLVNNFASFAVNSNNNSFNNSFNFYVTISMC